MAGFIRIFLYALAFYLAWAIISRFVGPLLFGSKKKRSNRFKNNNQDNFNADNKTVEGEYVDFEEVQNPEQP